MKDVKKILFLADHFGREWEIAKRTQIALNGAVEVAIMPQDIFSTSGDCSYETILSFRPNVIILPSLYPCHYWVLALAKVMSACVVVQHSEQFLALFAEDHKFDAIKRVKQMNLQHFVWTSTFGKRLEVKGVPKNRIYVTGSPKLSVETTVAKKTPEGYQTNSKRSIRNIVFVSNFLAADLTDRDFNIFLKTYDIRTSYAANRRLKTIRSRFIALAGYLVRRYSDKNFILRPHPGESLTPYTMLSDEFPNVSLSVNEPFSVMVEKADLAIIHDSTSIFELASAGIRIIAVELGMLDRAWRQQPEEVFGKRSIKEVKAFFRGGCIAAGLLESGPERRNLMRAVSELRGYDEKIKRALVSIDSELSCSMFSSPLSCWPRIIYSFLRSGLVQLGYKSIYKLSWLRGSEFSAVQDRVQKKAIRYGSALRLETIE